MSTYHSTTITYQDRPRPFFYRKPSSDEQVIHHVLANQQYDLRRLRRARELLEYAQRHADKGERPLVVDAGANIGASPVYFCANLPRARVVAIEPDRGNFDLLCKNVEGIDVEPMHAALTSKSGRCRVFDPGEGHWGYRTKPTAQDDADTGTVDCVTVNSIYQRHNAGFFPFIVKIDIEGGELDVFSANTEWIARTPLLIVELHDWLLPRQGTSRPFLECVAKLDRDFIYIGEDVYSIANDLG